MRADRVRTAIATHGTTDAAATPAQIANDIRHPRVSARGTATSGGRKVATAIDVV